MRNFILATALLVSFLATTETKALLPLDFPTISQMSPTQQLDVYIEHLAWVIVHNRSARVASMVVPRGYPGDVRRMREWRGVLNRLLTKEIMVQIPSSKRAELAQYLTTVSKMINFNEQPGSPQMLEDVQALIRILDEFQLNSPFQPVDVRTIPYISGTDVLRLHDELWMMPEVSLDRLMLGVVNSIRTGGYAPDIYAHFKKRLFRPGGSDKVYRAFIKAHYVLDMYPSDSMENVEWHRAPDLFKRIVYRLNPNAMRSIASAYSTSRWSAFGSWSNHSSEMFEAFFNRTVDEEEPIPGSIEALLRHSDPMLWSGEKSKLKRLRAAIARVKYLDLQREYRTLLIKKLKESNSCATAGALGARSF